MSSSDRPSRASGARRHRERLDRAAGSISRQQEQQQMAGIRGGEAYKKQPQQQRRQLDVEAAAIPPPPPPIIATVPSNVSTTPSMLSNTTPAQAISVESPLPPVVQRSLGDRSYDKRKNAALEVESLVKSLQESGNTAMIQSVLAVLSKDFCTSMNANYRKGGLIGIAASAIGLMGNTRLYLDSMLPPVLQCFDDPESRVRYYACESLYNIAKVARTYILRYFNNIFDGLTKLFADVDVDVKNGASLLDRLIKDIVTESESFQVEQFLPLLQTYIRRTNPYIRQLLVSWITVLDSVPDISMIDYLPDFLDGLFNMLSDSNREIRQAADSALSDFLREVRTSSVVEFGPMVSILVSQCHSRDALNRLTAMTWLAELIHHPHSGGDALLPYHAEVLLAIMSCLSDGEAEIRTVSERTNADLLALVRNTFGSFELSPLLDTLTKELLGKDDVPTKMAALRWINMLLEKRKKDMKDFISELLPVLLRTLSDPSDPVVILTLQVLSRISLADGTATASDPLWRSSVSNEVSSRWSKPKKYQSATATDIPGVPPPDDQFQMVLHAILGLFASDRRLLETRGSLIVRKLCVLLNAESVYIRMAGALSPAKLSTDKTKPTNTVGSALREHSDSDFSIEFIGTMVQTLNLILLSAAELHGLRSILAKSFTKNNIAIAPSRNFGASQEAKSAEDKEIEGSRVFAALFHCWCHNPVATFSLCLLAQAYDVAFALVKKFSDIEVTVGFLMQIDKLVQLLESPVFIHLRLQLLDVEKPQHPYLLKSCYGLLMLLPQSDAFRSLNDRLATVCNLRDNLIVSPSIQKTPGSHRVSSASNPSSSPVPRLLLERFDEVMKLHQISRKKAREAEEMQVESGRGAGVGRAIPALSQSLVAAVSMPSVGKNDTPSSVGGVSGKGISQQQAPPPPPSPSRRLSSLPETGQQASSVRRAASSKDEIMT